MCRLLGVEAKDLDVAERRVVVEPRDLVLKLGVDLRGHPLEAVYTRLGELVLDAHLALPCDFEEVYVPHAVDRDVSHCREERVQRLRLCARQKHERPLSVCDNRQAELLDALPELQRLVEEHDSRTETSDSLFRHTYQFPFDPKYIKHQYTRNVSILCALDAACPIINPCSHSFTFLYTTRIKRNRVTACLISGGMSKRAGHGTEGDAPPATDGISIEPRTTDVVLSVSRPYSDSKDLECRSNSSLYATMVLVDKSPRKGLKMTPVLPTCGNMFAPAALPMTHANDVSSEVYSLMFKGTSFKSLCNKMTYHVGYYLLTYIGKAHGIDPAILVASSDAVAKEMADGYFAKISDVLKHTKAAPPYSLFRFRDEDAHDILSFTDEGDLVQKDLFEPVFSSALLSKKRVRSAAFVSSEHKRKMVKVEPEPEAEADAPVHMEEIVS